MINFIKTIYTHKNTLDALYSVYTVYTNAMGLGNIIFVLKG